MSKVIVAIGEDYGLVGLDQIDVFNEFFDRLNFIYDLGLDCTGTLLEGGTCLISSEYNVNFVVFKPDGEDITIEEWEGFSEMYQMAYQTFDGYIMLADLNPDKFSKDKLNTSAADND